VTRLEFFTPGLPQTKGSAKGFGFVRKNGPRAGKIGVSITNDNPKAKGWSKDVARCAREHMGERELLTGPLAVEMTFHLPRPKKHSTGKGLRANAPRLVTTKPDVDKLARCLLDALTWIVFKDDALVARIVATKVYTSGKPGALVVVREADDGVLMQGTA
jgi:crossover junction endodeoxyribonuclease RusA